MAVKPTSWICFARKRGYPHEVTRSFEFGFCKLYQFVIHRFIIDGGVALIYCLQRFTVWKECSMAAVVEPGKMSRRPLSWRNQWEREISPLHQARCREALREAGFIVQSWIRRRRII